MRLVILICFEMETKLNPNLNLVAHLVSLDIPLANADFHLLICGLVSVRSRKLLSELNDTLLLF